jgi:hypothetical protein
MPRPSWPLIVNSVLFATACLFVGGFMLSGFVHWDPCMWVSATIFVGPSFAFAFWQYLATFRGNPRAAKRLFLSLLIVGGLLIFALGSAILEPLLTGTIPTLGYLGYAVLPMALLASWFVFTGILTFRWRNRLAGARCTAAVADKGVPLPHPVNVSIASRRLIPSFTLRELFGLMAALSAVLAGAAFGIRDTPPERAMHVSVLESHLTLPKGASDVCVIRGSRGIITFDFAIDEPGFWEWAKTRVGSLESQTDNVPIKAIEDSFSILSCSENANEYIVPRAINHGWFYSWHKEDRSIQYGYDADTGRAYYHAHFH